eukprot:TRINITY_DN2162_c0_g1_i1.p2 TRINITY_DN2162_c0_g1~~TRINITY_DN2162_c0_g1_i1.p2  ORF type:complete len:65 (+),score=5.77 TRINITY_DN2162_c0_g1_i1:207-401(+)
MEGECHSFHLYDEFGDGLKKGGYVRVFYRYSMLFEYEGSPKAEYSEKTFDICVGTEEQCDHCKR